MFMSHHQTAGQNHYIKAANTSFKNVSEFSYVDNGNIKIAFTRKLRAD
jgi:hypothetical protein